MTKKEQFINEVSTAVENGVITLSEEAAAYFETFKASAPAKEKPLFTDNGRMIIEYLKDNEVKPYPSKTVAEALGLSGRTVSGAMRKLIIDGYVSKDKDGDTTTYQITEAGLAIAVA